MDRFSIAGIIFIEEDAQRPEVLLHRKSLADGMGLRL